MFATALRDRTEVPEGQILSAMCLSESTWLATVFLWKTLLIRTSSVFYYLDVFAFPLPFPLQPLFQTMSLPGIVLHTCTASRSLRQPFIEGAACKLFRGLRCGVLSSRWRCFTLAAIRARVTMQAAPRKRLRWLHGRYATRHNKKQLPNSTSVAILPLICTAHTCASAQSHML